jgi:hypothetical protein
LLQTAQVIVPCKLYSAELGEMWGDELRIEQRKSAVDETRHEMDQRDLTGVTRGREHALPKKGGAELHAIEAAHQLAVSPGFDRMRVTLLMQFGV